jgi:hypothetical protein
MRKRKKINAAKKVQIRDYFNILEDIFKKLQILKKFKEN